MNTTTIVGQPHALPVKPDNIPLRVERRWLVWKYEWLNDKNRRTKVPYIATDTERKASATDDSTWRSFDEAFAAYEDGKCDGIGFVPAEDMFTLDIDHCLVDGKIPPSIHARISALATYTEISPSGDGLHVIGIGRKPGNACVKVLDGFKYELFASNRYLTLTGQVLDGFSQVRQSQAALDALYAEMAPSNGNPPTATASSSHLTDDALIAKASANEKFARLFKGDHSGYTSQSEADLALMCLLAFWSNKDTAQMARIFRQSKLMRDKFEREDYRSSLIATALATTAHTYTPPSLQLICADSVPPVKLEWLWHARLALGAITLVEGGPERGKSTILCDLAARVTRGHSFPGDYTTRPPGNVVMLIAEDDLGATVVPRLTAAGADLKRVFFLGVTKNELGEVVPFHLSDDAERLRVKCLEVNPVLIVLDPLVSFLGSRKGRVLNTNNDLEVRKSLGPLMELAEQLRASVAAIRHYRKGSGTDAIEAGGGSIGFAALVRVIIAALPDPRAEDDCHYLLAVAKNNLVAKSKRPALEYQIVPALFDSDIGCIEWGATVDMSAGEVLQEHVEASKHTKGKVADARAFLETFLANKEWVATTEIMDAAKNMLDLSDASVRRAREKLGDRIIVEKHEKKWMWRLVP